MDVDVVLLTGLDTFGAVLERVAPEDWERPSPCPGWSARALTGHVLTVLDSATTVMRGSSFDWSSAAEPAVVAGEDPLAAFRQRRAAARAALQDADLEEEMETPLGPMLVRTRVAFPAMDLHLHAWDLGRTINVPVEIADDVARFAHAAVDPMPVEMVRSYAVFGPEVPAPADATTTEALMAWTGRQPR
ncbi:MAG: hypothetical protein JWM02_3416 [Frankiales bacterium]|nr:hypothetical protein [Frankiales bacterium]